MTTRLTFWTRATGLIVAAMLGVSLGRAQDRPPPKERPQGQPPGVAGSEFAKPPGEGSFEGPRKPPVPPRGEGFQPGGFPGPKPPFPGGTPFGPGGAGERPIGPPGGVVQPYGPPKGPPGLGGGMPGFPGGMMPAPEGLRPGGVFDPRMAELDRTDQELNAKSVDLSMRFRHAPPAEREKIKQEISEAVNRHFDVRQERRELQLQRLEEELARLKESIQARQQAREEIVKKRLAELLGETDDLNF